MAIFRVFWGNRVSAVVTPPVTPPATPVPSPTPGGAGAPAFRRKRPEYRNAFDSIRRKKLDELEELKRQLLARVKEAPAETKIEFSERSTTLETLADISREIQRIQDEIDDEDDVEFLLLH